MLIRTRLILIGMLPLLLLLIFVGGMLQTQQQLDSYREKAVFANHIGKNFFNLFIAAHDMTMENKYERPLQQWSSTTQDLKGQLSKAKEVFSSGDETELIEMLSEYFKNSQRGFMEFSRWHKQHQGQVLSVAEKGYASRLTERLHVVCKVRFH